MIRKSKNGIEWLEFEKLSPIPGLVHGVFSRKGGVSPSPYTFLNAGGGSGDEPLNVEKNRLLIQQTLELPHLANGHQVHGDHLIHVKSPHLINCAECDALFTEEKGIGLMIKHADCQAAIFYDKNLRTLANVHSGWRGNVQNIYGKTVRFMQEKGSSPQDIIVCISPSLGPMASEFKHYEKEFPESFWPYQVKPFYFDLWEISKNQLLQAGILEENIEIAQICTYETPSDFFSYRREKTTGRNATIAALT